MSLLRQRLQQIFKVKSPLVSKNLFNLILHMIVRSDLPLLNNNFEEQDWNVSTKEPPDGEVK